MMSTISSNKMQSNDEDVIDLSVIIGHIRENKWLILMVTAIFLAAGVFYASRQAPLYQSNVLLQISNKQDNLAGLLGGAMGGLVGDRAGSAENPESRQIVLIKSKYILAPVIQSLGLDVSEQLSQGFIRRHFFPRAEAHPQVPIFDVPRDLLNHRLTLVMDKTNHFSLSDADGVLLLKGEAGALVTAEDGQLRLKIKGQYPAKAATYILTKHSVAGVTQQLSPKLAIKDLGGRENTGVLDISYTDTNPHKVVQILNAIAKTVKVKDARKKSLEASKTLAFLYQQLPLTKTSLEKSETALNKYRAKSGKIDIKVQSHALLMQLSDLDKQLGTLRLNKVDMLQRYTNEHPSMIAFNLQIEELETEKTQLENKLKTLPASDQMAVSLMRDVKVKNTLYLLLLNKIQELRVIKAGTVSDVSILSFASLADAPLPSKSTFIAVASMLLGFMISCLILLGRQLLFHRVDDPLWSERHFNIVNLVIIPYSKEQFKKNQSFKSHLTKDNPLLAYSNPRNLAIESLRSLRTSLQVSLSCAQNNIVSILGVSPGIGKSFISSNLAYLLATAGKRVLLIDGDLRRGILHGSFNLDPMPGLNEILNHKSTPEEALKRVHENLTFLPRGVYAQDPSELLMSDDFKNLLKTFSQQFDIVVLDTSPVLLVTDAVVIGTLSATNYLVIGSKMHHTSEIEVVIKRLANAGVNIHGSIFNFSHSQSQSHYYGKYKYNAYYGSKSH